MSLSHANHPPSIPVIEPGKFIVLHNHRRATTELERSIKITPMQLWCESMNVPPQNSLEEIQFKS